MKSVYLLRHGEKNSEGTLAEDAKHIAALLRKTLPKFARVISSNVPRAIQTATLLTNEQPHVDVRAGFYIPAEDNSRAIYEFGISKGINFFEAAELYQNGALENGIHEQAINLQDLINETSSQLSGDEVALIVSHDLTITIAMALRGLPKESSNYFSGYILNEEGLISKYTPSV